MKHIVVGLGEVGSALQQILRSDGYDNNKEFVIESKHYDFLHICIPYTGNFNFENQVNNYIDNFTPNYIVIHSTVPIGTCGKNRWTHSPIRGKHPNLKESILTFTKYVGGINALAIARELETYGIKCKVVTNADDTEAAKLYDLMQYATSILLSKHIYRMCKQKGLSFDLVYREFNRSYNKGYEAMKMKEFIRPVLEYSPGKIGGHCVIPMMELLDDPLAKDIINANENL